MISGLREVSVPQGLPALADERPFELACAVGMVQDTYIDILSKHIYIYIYI